MGPSRLLISFLANGLALVPGGMASAATPDLFDSKAQVPAIKYASAFAGYRPMADEPIAAWRESNELARRLGGWSAFAGGKTPDVQSAPTESAPKTRPVAGPKSPAEGGHGSHGKP